MTHARAQRRGRCCDPAAPPIDLYDYLSPAPKLGRPAKNLSDWRVVDDWPEQVPVTEHEVDVFAAWFGDILDELFGPA